MHLPNEAWVVVADGEKYLILENRGDEEILDLRVREVEDIDVPATHEAGTERPGRYPGGGGGRRSAVDQTDWKAIGKADFATHLAGHLDKAAAKGRFKTFVLMADARTMGVLRQHLKPETLDLLRADLVGDHVHQRMEDIEKAIRDA